MQLSPALSVLHWQRVRKWVFQWWVLSLITAVYILSCSPLSGQLSTTLLQRAQADLERTRELVQQGTIPRSSLEQAQERVDDAQDDVTLAETLYSLVPLQEMTSIQGSAMVAAAERRVDRAKATLEKRQTLLNMGIVSQAEMSAVRNEVTARQLVLDLAHNRVKLLDDLHTMALQEQRMELPTMQNSMIRHDGTAAFKLPDLAGIERAFKLRFQHELPVSAEGQTLVHQGLGLDHRNKVDVALNPEQPEGLWLRQYLEKQHLSYLAFRAAIPGAATGAHIHIGASSPRLRTMGSAPAR